MALGCQPLFEPGETSLIVDLRRAPDLERVMAKPFGQRVIVIAGPFQKASGCSCFGYRILRHRDWLTDRQCFFSFFSFGAAFLGQYLRRGAPA